MHVFWLVKEQHWKLDIGREDFSCERTWTALTAVLEELLHMLLSQCLIGNGLSIF